jgi:hypothetical protein
MKFIFSTHTRFAAVLLAVLFYGIAGQAQNAPSTYSRFGIGKLYPTGSMTHFGMGGLSTPIIDGSLINLSNPATYSSCGITTLQINALGSALQTSTETESMKYNSGQIHEMAMLFKKPGSKWAFAAGLTPYSTMSYKLNHSGTTNDSLKTNYIYNGTGGLNKLTIGTSRQFTFYKTVIRQDSLNRKDTTVRVPLHQLSVGLNANFIFGSLVSENQVEFSSASYYNTKEISKLMNKGWMLEGGLLYRTRLDRKEENGKVIGESHLFVGLDYQVNAGKLKSTYKEENSRYIYSNGVALAAGTTYSPDEIQGKMTLPEYMAIGAAFRKSHKKWGRYTVGVDFKMQDWSQFSLDIPGTNFLFGDYMATAQTVALGAEYEPSLATNYDLLHRMSYRAGIRNTQTHLKVNGTQIAQQAVSVGISIPVVRSMSRFHIGAEYMTSGTHDNELIMEKGFNFMVGFTLTPSERWFFQRKYD